MASGELISMLLGPLCAVSWVALDPIAEVVDARSTVALLSMSREDFLNLPSARVNPRRLTAGAGANAGSGVGFEAGGR